MKLTASQFDQRLQDGHLAVSFIGMSNTGKSFWTKRLARIGFERWSCDDDIEHRMGDELKRLGYQGLADMAKWMGQPYEARFLENQKTYLSHEIGSMKGIFSAISHGQKNWAIDTTGSVIYTGEEVLAELRRHTMTILIQATTAMKDEMFKKFLEHPKPIVWGDQYQPLEGESSADALARCYPRLLEYRAERYARCADVVIPYQHLNYEITGDQLLERIRKHL